MWQDVEGSFLKFAEVADLILILADPVTSRFHLRELQLYAQLLNANGNFKAKTHLYAWITGKHGADAELKKHLDMLKAALRKQVAGWEV